MIEEYMKEKSVIIGLYDLLSWQLDTNTTLRVMIFKILVTVKIA